MNHDEITARVRSNIDNLADKGVFWSIPVTSGQTAAARLGDLSLPHTPRDWLPVDLRGVKILCLAGAGGMQGPLLAAAGADVTVFDLSEKMLEQDRYVAKRDGLSLRLEQGDMCDLSRFETDTFDIVINPPSLFYIEDVRPVFRESARVLKKGGVFIMHGANPINYICDYIEDGGYFKACNTLPYKSYEHSGQGGWIEFGHTLSDYIGGQTECGFAITAFCEGGELCDSWFATRAILF